MTAPSSAHAGEDHRLADEDLACCCVCCVCFLLLVLLLLLVVVLLLLLLAVVFVRASRSRALASLVFGSSAGNDEN